MKLLICLFVAIILASPVQLNARKSDETARAFNAFWVKFKAAVATNDKKAVASMTKLPFLLDNEQRDEAGFIAIYNQFFDAKVKKCLAKAKPQRSEESYEVYCGDLILYFALVDVEFKFLEFGVND